MSACGGGGNNGGNEPGNTNSNTGGNNNDQSQPVVIADIPEIYNKRCLSCHAADLSGNMGKNSNLQRVGSRLDREKIEDIIRNGKPNTFMTAQASRLTEEEIEMLADWLSELK